MYTKHNSNSHAVLSLSTFHSGKRKIRWKLAKSIILFRFYFSSVVFCVCVCVHSVFGVWMILFIRYEMKTDSNECKERNNRNGKTKDRHDERIKRKRREQNGERHAQTHSGREQERESERESFKSQLLFWKMNMKNLKTRKTITRAKWRMKWCQWPVAGLVKWCGCHNLMTASKSNFTFV